MYLTGAGLFLFWYSERLWGTTLKHNHTLIILSYPPRLTGQVARC